MSKYVALALAATVLALPATAADKKFDADAVAKAVAPYLDDQTFAVLHVDLSRVDADALITKAAAFAKLNPEAAAPLRKETTASVKVLTDIGAHDLYVVASLADVPEHAPFVVLPLTPVKEAETENGARIAKILAKLKDVRIFSRPFISP